MGRVKLVLFSRDSRYADAFSEYCGRHEKERITVKTFTNEESLGNCLSKEHIDVLLTELIPGITDSDNCCERIVLLSDSRYVKDTGYPLIYKYQRMDIILKQLFELIAEGSPGESKSCSLSDAGPDIIGCFSPCYEEEREQYARALADYIGGIGRTLYINMAMFTSYDDEGEEGLSELLYYATGGEENVLAYRIPAFSRNTGRYEALPGVKNYLDLYDLDVELVKKFFDRITELSEYKNIIVDIGLIGDVADAIMASCNTVIMPVPYDSDKRRINHLKRDYLNATGEDMMERMKYVSLPDWWRNNPDGRTGWIREAYEYN